MTEYILFCFVLIEHILLVYFLYVLSSSYYKDGQSTELLKIIWNAIPVQRQENLTLPEFLLGDIETFQCDKAYVGSK